jgi:tetratricopeptide (TPR) repeat protein
MLLLEEGQWDDALPVLRKAIELNPALSKKVASLCVVSGKRLLDRGNSEDAERSFRAAADFDPNDIRSHTYLANCMVKRGHFEKAVEHYLHVCSIEPHGAIGFYNLAICYQKTTQMENAIKGFEHALALDPKMANAHFYLAKIYEGQKKREPAIKHWQACLKIAPGTPQAQRAQQRLTALTQVQQPPEE